MQLKSGGRGNKMRKLKFYKSILVEILETLCTICLYMEIESRRNHNPYGVYFCGHFEELKKFSEKIRKGENK